MAQEGEVRTGRSRPALPVVPIAGQKEMAVMLALHNRLLREYARRYLGEEVSEDEVEEAVQRTVEQLIALEDPSLKHGLRYATQQLRTECDRTHRRFALEQAPVDRRLGALIGPKRHAVDRLRPRARRTLLWAAQGWSAARIAHADNSTPQAVRERLYHARKRVLQLLSESGQSASLLMVLLVGRLRGVFDRRVPSLLIQGVSSQVAVTAAILPLVVASLLSPFPAAVSRGAPGQTRAAAGLSAGVSAWNLEGRSSPTAAPVAEAGRTARPGGVSHLVRATAGVTSLSAAAEVPGDMQLTAVATLPGAQSKVVVAIGTGQTCGCPVLTQSLDGGVTWTSTTGPPSAVKQLALPPTYPSDPRIFAGVNPLTGEAPFMAAAFGQPFMPLTGLPPGQVAVSAHLDDGDPRIFSAGLTGIWSVRLATSGPLTPHEEIDYSAGSRVQNGVAALATPTPVKGDPAILVWAPEGSFVPGSTRPPTLGAAVLRCPAAGPCTVAASLPQAPGALVTDDQTVLAFGSGAAYASYDLGASFTQLSLPDDSRDIASMALVGNGLAIWMTTVTSDGSVAVVRLLDAGGWVDASGGERTIRTHAGNLLALDQGRVIDAPLDAGYRCARADQLRWLRRCP